MAEWDPQSGKVRPTWTVRFSPWWVFVGSAVGGVVCALVLFITFVAGGGTANLNTGANVVLGGVMLLGLCFLAFILLGPMLAYGLGFMLRSNTNQGQHVAAFALMGLVVGFMLGNLIGLGSVIAPAAGIGAAAGRWIISSQA